LHKNVPDSEKLIIPNFASAPSRVLCFLNMLSVEELFEKESVKIVKEDLLNEVKKFCEILDCQIPLPDKDGICTAACGKIFVKCNHPTMAKQARYKLAGRKYNGRTVVISFYPEHYFDIREFSIV